VLVVLLGAAGFGGARGYDWFNWQVNTPVSTTSQPVVLHVQQGASITVVADQLQEKGLIRDREVFRYYVRLAGLDRSIQAGDYVLNKNMSMRQIAEALQHGRPDQVAVTIPEGYPAFYIATAIESANVGMKAVDYLRSEQDGSWQADFLASRNGRKDLEGYLFPDTYSLNRGAGVRDLIQAQLDQFARVFTPELRQKVGQATDGRPPQTIEQIVILASIVDREVNNASDRANACSVFYNRLQIGMPLGADATVLYALGRVSGGLTDADLHVSSPYNTRTHAGLPPGPISNPAAAAIRSCIDVPKTAYLFYFTDKQGVTHFEKTQAEFEADKRRYGVSGE